MLQVIKHIKVIMAIFGHGFNSIVHLFVDFFLFNTHSLQMEWHLPVQESFLKSTPLLPRWTEELAEFIRALHNPESTLTTKCSECVGTSTSYPSEQAFLLTSCACSFLLVDCQGMQKRKSSSLAKTCCFMFFHCLIQRIRERSDEVHFAVLSWRILHSLKPVQGYLAMLPTKKLDCEWIETSSASLAILATKNGGIIEATATHPLVPLAPSSRRTSHVAAESGREPSGG